MTGFDWLIVVGCIALTTGVGLFFSKQSATDTQSFFLAGRRMPWWLLGTSMVATTFATDTPLLVADIVRTNGVAGNWVWWAFLLTGMLTTFVYAKLWRRSGAVTDLEFYELRYSGTSARAVRAFRALYLGLFFNVIVMATVLLAAIKVGSALVGIEPLYIVIVVGTVALLFSALGGFAAVLAADALLFVLSMSGALLAAWFALDHPAVGGLEALIEHDNLIGKLSFLPDFGNPQQALMVFVIPLAVQWWNVWYPGAEPGGGGYVAQRLLAAKNEQHATAAILLFQVAHYALRPWPWIIVALASLVVFPDINAIKGAFPAINASVIGNDFAYPAMLTFLPAGILGVVVASLVAACISTLSTQINWGASYIVHDFYQRFVNPTASDATLIRMARVASVVLVVLAAALALALTSVIQAFSILLTIGAGTGLLFILRWFWWRINAWSEISAMLASFACSLSFYLIELPHWADWQKLVASISATTAVWLSVTWLTPATRLDTLQGFYRLIRPGGPGWRQVANSLPDNGRVGNRANNDRLAPSILCAFLASISVYALMFSTGYALYGNTPMSALMAALAITTGGFAHRCWRNNSGN